MTSIRRYLVVTTIACITLTNFISALQGYRSSMLAAQQLFDEQLTGMARMLAIARKKQVNQKLITNNNKFMVFQIWREDQVLVARSDSAPITPIAPFEVGYRDLNFGGYRWRIYVHHDDLMKEWTIIAERSDIRSGLAEKVIMEAVLPTLLALPILALMIWVVVGLGLKPISKLARQLHGKESDDLTPLPIDASLVELDPLIESTNGLLHRLETSFLREKRFAAEAAHELRTPISTLKVHLYNLQAEWPGQVAKLLPFKQSVDRLERLVEQILALYRSTPEQYMAKFKAIELFELAQTTIVADYNQFDDKQQKIELLGEPSYLNGDQFALQTLLQNLLSNACKYSPLNGSIIITVSTTDMGTILCVEDSGPGIAEGEYQKVFERFYRVHDNKHDTSRIGSGLGLAIVKHIAELHGASIKLGHSRFNTGLSITLIFSGTGVSKHNAMILNISASEHRR